MKFSKEELLLKKKKRRKTSHVEITPGVGLSWGKEEPDFVAPKVPGEISLIGPSLGMVGNLSRVGERVGDQHIGSIMSSLSVTKGDLFDTSHFQMHLELYPLV